MARVYSKNPQINRSLKYSVRDAVAYSVASGGGETYFSAFALFLKATTSQIALLASLPPLLGSFMQLISAWLGHYTGKRKMIILLGTSLQAFIWVPMALLPFFFPHYAVELLIGCVVFFYAAGNLASPQWGSLMGDLVPERWRGRYFARRTRLASMTAFIALVSAGLLLHSFTLVNLTLAGYILIFLMAGVARLLSVHYLRLMHDPPGKVAALEMPFAKGWWRRLRGSAFVKFSLFFAMMQMAVSIASPFFTVYMLRDLKFSYFEFMMNTAMIVLTQFLTLNMWGRISDVFGNRLILVLTGAIIPFLPCLWLVSESFWYLLSIQVIGGFCWAGFSLSAGNFLYDMVPADKRATYLAIHNVLAASGVFIGAMLGGYLAMTLPAHITIASYEYSWMSVLYGVFVISTLARLMVALIFLPRLKEVRQVRQITMPDLIFRVTRFNALSGLVFDIVGVLRKRTNPR